MASRRTVRRTSTRRSAPSRETTIDGETYNLRSKTDVVKKIKKVARENGYGKFDVRNNDDEDVSASEICVGGNYKVVPRAQMG